MKNNKCENYSQGQENPKVRKRQYSVGDIIRIYSDTKKLTHNEIMEKSGIPHSTFYDLLNDKHQSAYTIKKLEEALDIRIPSWYLK